MGQLQGGFSIMFLTMSSKMLGVPVVLRLVDLLVERGVLAAGGEVMGGVTVGV